MLELFREVIAPITIAEAVVIAAFLVTLMVWM